MRDSKDIISQPSIAPFSEKKIPLESSWWVDIKNCWLQSIRLVNDDRKRLEWRQGLPWHWNWGIEQPKCTWKPEREGYNGECVRLMHHWKSYEIYLRVRWPSRDEKMWLHSLCEMKQRRSAIFYRILRNQHSPSIYTWWTFWEYIFLSQWCNRKLRCAGDGDLKHVRLIHKTTQRNDFLSEDFPAV